MPSVRFFLGVMLLRLGDDADVELLAFAGGVGTDGVPRESIPD